MSSDIWIRVRFKTDPEDFRPVKFPPPGPYWCSGYSFDPDRSILVAYVKNQKQLFNYWPDAEDVDILSEESEIRFSERFPKPEWYNP